MGDKASASNMTRIMPDYEQPTLIRETALPAFDAAQLVVNSDHVSGGMREVNLHLQSPSESEYINLLFPTDAGISAVEVNGFPVEVPGAKQTTATEPGATSPQNWWRLRWYGLPRGGADVLVKQKAGHSLPIKIIEVDYEMPGGAPVRPDDSMSKKYTWSDSTVIFQTVILE